MPTGSVRALALFIILAIDAYMWATGKPIDEFQRSVTLVVMTYYFASRPAGTTEEPQKQYPPGTDLLEEARKQLGE